jgi:hypothetical protein
MHSDHLLRADRTAHRPHSADGLAAARAVPFARILRWPAGGWRAAQAQPLLWLALALAGADCVTLAVYVPQLWLLAALVAPGFIGAAALAEARTEGGRPATVRELRRALLAKHEALLVTGLYGIAMTLLARAAVTGLWHALVPAQTAGWVHALGAGLDCLPFVLAAALAGYAPVLVVLRDLKPADAVLASLRAAAANRYLVLAALALSLAVGIVATQVPFAAATAALVLGPLVAAALLMAARGASRDLFGA